MKKQNTTQYLKLLGMVCLGLASMPARAGDQTFGFDTDPTLDPNFILVGANATSAWWATGGNPSSGGYLELTPAVGSQNLCIVFPDVDSGYPVKGFRLTMDCRVGNGTTERPADGFSINYCREGDPVLVNATNGVTGGAAGGDDAATCLSPTGSGDLENGTKTGVAILFDAWAGNWWADTGAGGVPGPDSEGLAVRVDDKTLFKRDMSGDRNGNCTYATQPDITVCQAAACADSGTMQTGPWDGGSGIVDVLCWQPLIVELDTNKQVTVTWKGTVMLDHFQLTQYPAHRGRLVLMGRTGGNNQNVNFDNIHLVTIPAVEATFGSLRAGPALNQFTFTIEDNGISAVTNVPSVKLDGADVTSQCVVTKSGPTTTVTYTGAANFVTGSGHSVDAVWQTSLGQTLNALGVTFTQPNWVDIPAEYAVDSVDTTKPGFFVQPWQQTPGQPGQPNRLYWTDLQLLGFYGPNAIDFSSIGGTNNSQVVWEGLPDFSNDADPTANGQFTAANTPWATVGNDWAYFGIPAPGTAYGTPADNSTAAFMTYLYFPTPGTYTFGGNSDDGIRMTIGKNSHDILGIEVPGMTADVGRGIGNNQNQGSLVISKAGYYGARLLFENGGGGCNVEWYTKMTPAGTTNVLVNDLVPPGGVKAYRYSAVNPAYVSYANVPRNDDQVWPNSDLVYKLTDGASAVVSGSVTLSLDGVVQAPTVNKVGTETTVTLAHSGGLWASASKHTVDLAFADANGTNYSYNYSFNVLTYKPIPADIGVALGSEDATKPGFVMNFRQADPGAGTTPGAGNINNYIYVGEQMVAGLYGPNSANVSNPISVPTTINFDIDLAANNGDFNPNNGFQDQAFPGLPSSSVNPNESFAGEYLTWVEFKTAGVYGMCINSDDGFLTTYGLSRPTDIGQITVNSPASIAGDKVAVMCTASGEAAVSVTNLVTGKLVMYQDANGDNLAGLPASNAAQLAGNIALIQRGTYGFAVKTANAQAAGAIAVIVGQNRPDANPADGRFPIEMGGTPTAGIPGVMTDLATYIALTNAIAAGDVNVTLHPMNNTAAEIGEANYGKGASQINFNIFVPAPGLYPFRTMSWQGGGGGNCEWSTYDSTGAHVLLNDASNPKALRAFQAVKVAPRPTMNIATTGGVTKITYTGTLQSSATADGTYTDVNGATSPYTVNTSTGNMFFRARN